LPSAGIGAANQIGAQGELAPALGLEDVLAEQVDEAAHAESVEVRPRVCARQQPLRLVRIPIIFLRFLSLRYDRRRAALEALVAGGT
jgi:hypothetical protein